MDDVKSIQQPRKKGQKKDSKQKWPSFQLRDDLKPMNRCKKHRPALFYQPLPGLQSFTQSLKGLFNLGHLVRWFSFGKKKITTLPFRPRGFFWDLVVR